MKFIRVIIFLPVCLLVFGIINWALGHLVSWFVELNLFWLIILMLFLGGFIWETFKFLAMGLIVLSSAISPSKTFSSWTLTVLGVLNGLALVISAWSMEIQYSGKVILVALLFSALAVELTMALVIGAFAAKEV